MAELWPLHGGILTRALAEAVLAGAACGPVGVWILIARQTYAAESLSHAMLPGLVVAALIGAPLLAGAFGGLLTAALVVALAARDRRIGGDTAVAVAVTAMLGLGALLALGRAVPARIGDLLFGDLLGVSGTQLAATAALAAVIGALLLALHRSLSLSLFDRASARALGSAPARADAALLALLAVTIGVAVQALGNLLVIALIVGPAVAALRIARSIGQAVALAAALGAGAGVAGLWASAQAGTAAGASIALVAVAVALASGLRGGGTGRDRGVRRSPVDLLSGAR